MEVTSLQRKMSYTEFNTVTNQILKKIRYSGFFFERRFDERRFDFIAITIISLVHALRHVLLVCCEYVWHTLGLQIFNIIFNL